MYTSFCYAHAAAADWSQATHACLDQLGAVSPAANLGFIYISDVFADDAPEILTFFKQHTGLQEWVGSVGIGVCGGDCEYMQQPAIAVMLGEFPADSFVIFSNITRTAPQIAGQPAYFAITHADPETHILSTRIKQLAGQMDSGFLTGGLSSSRYEPVQIARDTIQGGLTGVMFTSAVPVATRLTQGCSPIGRAHRITACQDNIISSLDGRRAFDVFREDIGEVLARDLSKVAGYIFAGLPVAGSDTGDYVVRNLLEADPESGLLAIGAELQVGMPILFCRRDAISAEEDMLRMLTAIKRDLRGPPRGGVYYSCLCRGANLFGSGSVELQLIRQVLGEFPLVGFFANGEISHNRVYGYTGVLTLFI